MSSFERRGDTETQGGLAARHFLQNGNRGVWNLLRYPALTKGASIQ